MFGAVPHVEVLAGNEMVVEFLFVLDHLDAEKDGAETQRGDQENADQLLFPDLRGPHSHGHGQAAHDQHDGVEAAELDIERVASGAEGRAERMSVNGVGKKEAAEEQDFGDQENPHAKRGGFLLLLERFKMSVQLSGAMHSVLLLAIQRMASTFTKRGGQAPPYKINRSSP